MPEKIYAATMAGSSLDGSADGSYVVMRGASGDDTLTGSAFNDRLSGGAGHNLLNGGAGDDSLFTALTPHETDTLDGGIGHDSLYIALSSAQLAQADVKAALVALNTFLTYTAPSDPAAHFVNATLGLDMIGVEAAKLRVDGVLKSLDEAGAQAVAPAPQTHAITFDDVGANTDPDEYPTIKEAAIGTYHGYVWTSDSGAAAINKIVSNMEVGFGPAANSFLDYELLCDRGMQSPLSVTKEGGGTFFISQLDVATGASYYPDGVMFFTQEVTITGTRDGAVIGTVTATAGDGGFQTIHMDWGAIDMLTVSWTDNVGVPLLDNIWLS